MWSWLKNLFGSKSADQQGHKQVKNFDEETADMAHKEYHHSGQKTINTDKIVGSVGRAHELDEQFRYRKRAQTTRFHSIQDAMREGKPMEPIKVVRVKRDRRDSEYFVLDGHHRVAQAKKDGHSEMNADVTDVMQSDNDDMADVTSVENDAEE